MIRAVIVDDELHAREELEALLRETGDVEVVERCANAIDAIQAIRRERPDVLFLDIQMPVIGGFELLAMLEEELIPSTVFVTAHDEFAIRAFEANAADYLLKPVDRVRLARTIEKLKRRPRDGAAALYASAAISRIPCLGPQSIKLVDVAEVEFVRSSAAGVYVVTADGEHYTDLTLKVLEAKAHLLRCHKQFLVNVGRIDEIRLSAEEGVAAIRTKSGKSVPVSRRHLTKVRDALGI